MKLRNDTGKDACPFGIHLAESATVAVSDDLDPAKLEYLKRNFTVLSAAKPQAKPAPKPAAAVPPKPQRTGSIAADDPEATGWATYTKRELLEIARDKGVDKYYALSKDELVSVLEELDPKG